MHFDKLLRSEDIRRASELAADIILNKPRSARFKAFSDNSALKKWTSEKSNEIAKAISSGIIDASKMAVTVEEILEITLIEGFFIGYTLLSNLNKASEESGSPFPVEAPLLLELWERGLLGEKEYQFEAKGDPYLEEVLSNFQTVTSMKEKIERIYTE